MTNLLLEATETSPAIDFNAETGLLKISGKMISISATEYSYLKPILEWVTEYSLKPAIKSILEINLDYCSSSGYMVIHQVLQIFDDLHKNNHETSVIWHYFEDDEDNEEKGLQFQDMFKLPIQLVVHSKGS